MAEIKSSQAFQETHGFVPTPELMMHVAQAMLVIAGADGEVSPREWDAFTARAKMYGYPDEAIAALKQFDYKTANIEDFIPTIKKMGIERGVVYDAIKLSRADGVYHELEKAMVARAASLLNVEPEIVVALEGIAEAEDALAKARIALLKEAR